MQADATIRNAGATNEMEVEELLYEAQWILDPTVDDQPLAETSEWCDWYFGTHEKRWVVISYKNVAGHYLPFLHRLRSKEEALALLPADLREAALLTPAP